MRSGRTAWGKLLLRDEFPRIGTARWNPWQIGPGIVFVVVYVLLDRVTVFFQMWAGVSAWYPPVGLALGLMVGLEYAPVVLAAGTFASIVNYHQSPRTATFWAVNITVVGGTRQRRICCDGCCDAIFRSGLWATCFATCA